MIDYALVPDHAQTAAALREVDAHLDGFPKDARSAAFERLSAQGVASLLHLPFYDASTDPGGAGPRVTWRGQGSMCSPHGADGLAVALGCWIVIEATRKTGTNQWTQEFGPCVDHVAEVASDSGAEARTSGRSCWQLSYTPTHSDTRRHGTKPMPRSWSCLSRSYWDLLWKQQDWLSR